MRPTFFSSIGDRRRSCQPVHCREDFLFFSSFPAGQGQTAVVCCARPAIHMAEGRSLVAFFLLASSKRHRRPGTRGSLGTLLAERGGGATVPKKAGPGSLWPCCTRWLEKIAGDRSRPGGSWVFPPPARDLPRVPVRSSGQLWANRTWSARRPRCAFLRLQYLFPGRSATRGRLLMGMGLNGGDITTKSCSGVVGR